MAPVWHRFRAELRTRWRAWLGLGLMVGLASGAAMTFAAGARRTDSAYSRFLDSHNAYDVMVVNYPSDGTAVFDFDELEQLPQVADSARAGYEYLSFFAANIVSIDGRIGSELNEFKILEGRAFDPDEPEMVVSFTLAEEHHIEVGDRVELLPSALIELLNDGKVDEALAEFGDATPEELEAVLAFLERSPDGTVEVVGIEASPGEFPPQFVFNRPLVHLSPALASFVDVVGNSALLVRLDGGSDAVDEFLDELEARSEGLPLQVIVQRDHAAAVERSIHFQAVALWLLAGLTALTATLIVGQVLARLVHLESAEHPTLRALGMDVRTRVLLGAVRAAAIGAVGAVVGVVGALLASRFFPTGLARTAEPNPGFQADLLVLGGGAVLTAALVTALSALTAWRIARAMAMTGGDVFVSSRVVRALVAHRGPVPAVVGTRMALEPGRGRSAVPVRTTLAGVVLGIAALTAAVTFGASLTHLVDTPSLYGVTWDLELVDGDGSGLGEEAEAFLRDDERVDAVALGAANFGDAVEVDGHLLSAMVFEAGSRIAPAVLEGRPPRERDEIAVGARTLRSLDAAIGDRVTVRVPGDDRTVSMRVVGTAVFPTVSEHTQLGRGALVTPEAAAALEPADAGGAGEFDDGDEGDQGEFDDDGDREEADDEDGEEGEDFEDDEGEEGEDFEDDDGNGTLADEFCCLLTLRAAADRDALLADLGAELGVDEERGEALLPNEGGRPTDIVNFGRVDAMPFVLGAVLAVVSAAALAHLLLSAVQRRRRDLALLKTIGLERRQVATVIGYQATTVAVIGLVIGVPVGIAVGRWVWRLMAENLGVVPAPQVPVWTLLLTVVGVVVLANVIAFVPGRLAARTHPATDLQPE